MFVPEKVLSRVFADNCLWDNDGEGEDLIPELARKVEEAEVPQRADWLGQLLGLEQIGAAGQCSRERCIALYNDNHLEHRVDGVSRYRDCFAAWKS